MNKISIDIETLGTNVDSTILSIGACTLDCTETFYATVAYTDDEPLNATIGTMRFWQGQQQLPEPADCHMTLESVLYQLTEWLRSIGGVSEVWANGTKFDIGMLEYQFKHYTGEVPWPYNADRCMRTLRKYDKALGLHVEQDIPQGRPHHALDDAIWQAMYISKMDELITKGLLNND